MGAALERERLTLATIEDGTLGALAGLLADVPALTRSTISRAAEDAPLPDADALRTLAAEAARSAGASIGLAVATRVNAGQTPVRAAIAMPDAPGRAFEPLELRLFQGGAHGRFRAAVAGAAHLVEALGGPASGGRGPA